MRRASIREARHAPGILRLATASNLVEHTAALGGTARLGNVSSFGVDADGELFIVNYSGSILRVLGAPPMPSSLRIIP